MDKSVSQKRVRDVITMGTICLIFCRSHAFDFSQGAVQEMLNLSQQEYVSRIDELNQALIHAWEQDQRVKALKIAIQVRLCHYTIS